MPKRPADDSPARASPSKRPNLRTLPKSTPPRTSTGSSVRSTPYTPYTPYSTSVPSDSPTNPFGFKHRLQKLALPPATSFSKHLSLRFQLVESPELSPAQWPILPSSMGMGKHKARAGAWHHARREAAALPEGEELPYDEQGVYRIVQVPLSYTFRHLHKLVLFLFAGDPSPPPPPLAPSSRGYLFEAHDQVAMGPRPGQIASARTWAKLSSVRDPYYSAQSILSLVESAEDDDLLANALDVEGDDWRWETEEDLTLAHVWETKGGDVHHAITYHHDERTTIHITVNTQKLVPRKGVGNKPFVFRAFGSIHLDPSYVPPPPPKPRLVFPVLRKPPHLPGPHRADPKRKTAARAAGDDARDRDPDQDEREDEDDFDGGLDTRHWNRPDTFERFLASAAQPTRPASPPSPALPPSSPSSLGPDPDPDGERDRDLSFSSSFSSSPLRLPVVTPAPARALTRIRVDRAQRRIERLVRRAMEEAEALERAERGDAGEGEEVDQLEGDADADAEGEDEGEGEGGKGREGGAFRDEEEV